MRPLDRAVVLEKAWEAQYLAIAQQRNPVPETDSTLARPMLAVRNAVLDTNPSGWLPILMLSGTSVQTGRRIIASDIDTRGLFRDAYDLHDLLSKPGSMETVAANQSMWDIRLSTAVTISARFPGISPHGDIVQPVSGQVIDRVVDGGYYENFGITTALELADALESEFRYSHSLFSSTMSRPCRSSTALIPGRLKSPCPTLGRHLRPLDALLGTRLARGSHAAAQLCKSGYRDRFAFVTVSQPQEYTRKELSASWWLSKYVQRYLDGELSRTNAQALAKILYAR